MSQSNFDYSQLSQNPALLEKFLLTPGNLIHLYNQNKETFIAILKSVEIKEEIIEGMIRFIQQQQEKEDMLANNVNQASREEKKAFQRAEQQLRITQVGLEKLKAQIQLQLQQANIEKITKTYDIQIDKINTRIEVLSKEITGYQKQAETAEQAIKTEYENLNKELPQIQRETIEKINEAKAILDEIEAEDNDEEFKNDEEIKQPELVSLNLLQPIKNMESLNEGQNVALIHVIRAHLFGIRARNQAIPGLGEKSKEAKEKAEDEYNIFSKTAENINQHHTICDQARSNVQRINSEINTLTTTAETLKENKKQALEENKKQALDEYTANNKPSFRNK